MDVLEQGPARPTRRRAVGLGVAAVVVAALGAGGVAYAQTTSPSPSPSPSGPSATPNTPKAGGHGLGRLGPRMGAFGFGGALHGQFTVKTQDGTYQTVAVQTGTVQSVDDDSITVKSEDGYTKTYAVPSSTWVNATRDGLASIKKGNTVNVQATVSGDKLTAERILDLTQAKNSRPNWGPFERHKMGPGQPKTATPSPSSTPS
jgi:hypothetical protein